ncbi:AraC family transcriptional regulator [Rhizobium sp. EC-SD404]|uniref:helix-turn-helix transcriptional regulator n=1 Tax=Rhizobium sp. EC-SD404 TaxID=2038389 RepID=UPI00125320C9|nr:AraC family transcriptional regulator [Rhizobium sp. EC-SD404]VVT24865.1 putative AraC family transcriptional regulatory protein [Rhizobium sp. EC-SD404]
MQTEDRTADREFSSFAEFWVEGEWAPFVETVHPGGRSPHTLAVFQQPAGAFPDPPLPEFQLQLVAKGSAQSRVEFGGTAFSSQLSPGGIYLSPPDTDCNYEVEGLHRIIALAINKNAMDRFREQADFELPRDFGRLHEQKFHDPIIEALMLRMLEQAMVDHPTSDLFLDQSTNTILVGLLCRSGTMQPDTEDARPLSDGDIAKVSRIIDERLEDNLSIADLARVTSLSDWHFARAFKQATGLSPHQYVLRRRIARAIDLLRNSQIALAEVALSAGFSSQSHMTDVFRQKVGTTPGKYRDQIKA